MTGVRWAESSKRAKRRLIETCYKDNTKNYVNPILNWSNSEIWEFIRSFQLPYCELYDQGFNRIGCLFCPMNYYKRRIEETKKYPKHTKAFIGAFQRLYDKRISQGNNSVSRWKNGEEMFWWWINDVQQEDNLNKDQLHLFP